jgi:hypothetical protein
MRTRTRFLASTLTYRRHPSGQGEMEVRQILAKSIWVDEWRTDVLAEVERGFCSMVGDKVQVEREIETVERKTTYL